MAHDIRNSSSKSRVAARTKIDENLDEINDYVRDLIHEFAGTDELRLEAETSRILAALKAGLAQPGTRITVIVGNTILEPSNNGTGLAAPHMLGSGLNPAPLAPAPTASIEEQLGSRLVQTFDADEAFKLLDGAVSRNMRTAAEVLNCVDAFEAARQSRQYTTLLAYAAQVATAIASGDVLRNTGGDIVPASLHTKITSAQSATQIAENNLDTVVQDVFGGTMPSFPTGSNEKVSKTCLKVAELRQEGTAFKDELTTHTGVDRNSNESIQDYVQRALNGRRTSPPAPATAGTLSSDDLDKIGKALRMPRPANNNDGQYHTHLISQIEAERRLVIQIATVNMSRITFDANNDTISKIITALVKEKESRGLGRVGLTGTLQMPVIRNNQP